MAKNDQPINPLARAEAALASRLEPIKVLSELLEQKADLDAKISDAMAAARKAGWTAQELKDIVPGASGNARSALGKSNKAGGGRRGQSSAIIEPVPPTPGEHGHPHDENQHQ
ncbi:hypothetical protein [Mycobacteroides abscessus]